MPAATNEKHCLDRWSCQTEAFAEKVRMVARNLRGGISELLGCHAKQIEGQRESSNKQRPPSAPNGLEWIDSWQEGSSYEGDVERTVTAEPKRRSSRTESQAQSRPRLSRSSASRCMMGRFMGLHYENLGMLARGAESRTAKVLAVPEGGEPGREED